MLRLFALLACSIVLSLVITSAEAKKLPCGDYDGAPSHNDCAPVSPEKTAQCQKWIDKGNATSDAKRKEHYKNKYIKCVGVN